MISSALPLLLLLLGLETGLLPEDRDPIVEARRIEPAPGHGAPWTITGRWVYRSFFERSIDLPLDVMTYINVHHHLFRVKLGLLMVRG